MLWTHAHVFNSSRYLVQSTRCALPHTKGAVLLSGVLPKGPRFFAETNVNRVSLITTDDHLRSRLIDHMTTIRANPYQKLFG